MKVSLYEMSGDDPCALIARTDFASIVPSATVLPGDGNAVALGAEGCASAMPVKRLALTNVHSNVTASARGAKGADDIVKTSLALGTFPLLFLHRFRID